MGKPKLDSGVAIRMSQTAAIAKPPAHGVALDLRDDGLAHALQPAGSPLAVALVLDPVLRGLEALELADVGAGDEGLAARAAQHEDPDGVVGVHLFAGLVEPLVHVPRQRVAGFGAIEGECHHGTLAGDEDFALLGSGRHGVDLRSQALSTADAADGVFRFIGPMTRTSLKGSSATSSRPWWTSLAESATVSGINSPGLDA